MTSFRFALAIVLAASLLTGCASTGSTTASMQGDAARPAQSAGWIRSELYFAVGNEDGTGTIHESQWRAFLDGEVTPRFPDGLTVLDGYGQWRFQQDGRLVRQRCKVLVVLHEDGAKRREDIEAIRLAWKRVTGHESVLWARGAVDVSF
ncbi:DUF3574 domain-containing protein [Lysobacter sp. MMG2]|uniref:DUF3574 domain-containing protein n=1 Tax=Lysobacter sp. MMG2 TaxID=2801338 RepID=UPI001C242496|nr:DUF3574 domain-containing protein [Lysobacter sp. MMG2]MBU8975534.1 DUF3574 domain-containing protein [Lysobacter sp. MMG2]